MKLCHIATAVMLSAASLAQASTIKIETATATMATQSSAAGYKTAVNNALTGSTYQSVNVTAYDALRHSDLFTTSNSNFAWKATITFTTSANGNMEVRSAPDFGFGGAIFLDDVAKDFVSYDVYDPQYSNTANYFNFTATGLAAGTHTISIYGLEGCCDGIQQAQFRFGNSAFASFSSTDGMNVKAVPEPGTLALAGLGLAGIVATRRRRKAEQA